jgi:hypothetical protein
MRRAFYRWVILAIAFVASPVAAQQIAENRLPGEDQTALSVPPAPPPPRQAQTPPPFPSFPYVEPRRRHVQATRHPTRAAHVKTAKRPTKASVARHARIATGPKLSKREKKDQRYCGSLSKRQLRKNSKCVKLLDKRQDVTPQRQLTKQQKKDERYCGNLSLREVLRNSKCRKVAERQLETRRESPHRSGKLSRQERAKAKLKAAHGRTSAAKKSVAKKAVKRRR